MKSGLVFNMGPRIWLDTYRAWMKALKKIVPKNMSVMFRLKRVKRAVLTENQTLAANLLHPSLIYCKSLLLSFPTLLFS